MDKTMGKTMTLAFVRAVLGLGQPAVMKLLEAGVLRAEFVIKDGDLVPFDRWEFYPDEVRWAAAALRNLRARGVRPTANCLIGYHKGWSTGKG